ncbi:hypothetical protein LTR86_000614 [Recurvomyces mirabilis]|nr:hypothetical protein LTR86_000614 [Recurvomyces mirabilis]
MPSGNDNLFNIFRVTNKLTSLGHEVPRRLKNVMTDTLVELNKEINTYTQVNGHVRGQHKGLSEQIKELQTEITTLRGQVHEANNVKAATQATASQTVADLRRQAEQVEGEYLALQRQFERCQGELSTAHDAVDSAQAARAVTEAQFEALKISMTESAAVANMVNGEQTVTSVTAATAGLGHDGSHSASGRGFSTPPSTGAPAAESAADQGPANAKKRKLTHGEDVLSAETFKFAAGENFFQQTLNAVMQSNPPPAEATQNETLPGEPSILTVTDTEMEEFRLFDDEDQL